MTLDRVTRSSRTAAPGPPDRAQQVLAVHQAGPDGWCSGCARDGALTFYPCPSAAWASRAAGPGPARGGQW